MTTSTNVESQNRLNPQISSPSPLQRRPIESAHPHVLALVAHLFGHTAPAAESARILELGCANGGHLVPLAALLPHATLVGTDQDANGIAAAKAFASRMGLANIAFRCVPWNEIGTDLGKFDYILCHDIFSSVGSHEQQQLLMQCKSLLTPQGVAYISYKTNPGPLPHRMIRDMMQYHARRFSDPARRMARAREILHFIGDAARDEPLQQQLKNESIRLSAMSDAEVTSECLDSGRAPVYFHEFTEMLEKCGLQFLGEADFTSMMPSNLAPEVMQALYKLSENDILMMEQYMDFINGRDFRQSLVCHAALPLDRHIMPQRLNALCLSSQALEQAASAPVSGAATTFMTPDGQAIETTSALLRRALHWLNQQYPARVACDALWAALEPLTATECEQLRYELLLCATSGIVNLSLHPYQPRKYAANPVAWPIARDQAQRMSWASSRLHQVMDLEALPIHAAVLIILDGTHGVHDVNRVLVRRVLDGRLKLERHGALLTDPEALRVALAEWIPEIVRDFDTFGFLLENN